MVTPWYMMVTHRIVTPWIVTPWIVTPRMVTPGWLHLASASARAKCNKLKKTIVLEWYVSMFTRSIGHFFTTKQF